MANLVLRNPSEPPETLKAIITAINLDEAQLANTATAASVTALTSTVTTQGTTIASQGTSIAALQTTIPATEAANKVLSGPASGAAAAPAFRLLVAADLPPVLVPTVIYSAAGTPLPAASSALKGARAVVSDATTPLYLTPYSSGGAIVCPVFCDGTQWVTA